jgi:hypothetical protein
MMISERKKWKTQPGGGECSIFKAQVSMNDQLPSLASGGARWLLAIGDSLSLEHCYLNLLPATGPGPFRCQTVPNSAICPLLAGGRCAFYPSMLDARCLAPICNFQFAIT